MLWLYLACKEKWEEIVDTKKVGGDISINGGGRCWNSLLCGERSSNPLVRGISINGGGRCWNSLLCGEWSSNPLARGISIALH